MSDGNWSDPATWESGTVPTDDSAVTIASGTTVTLDTETARTVRVDVEGTFTASTEVDSHLKTETLYVADGGTLNFGSPSAPLHTTVDVTFVDTGGFDVMTTRRGLVAHGAITVHGREKTAWTNLASHPVGGDTTLDLPSEPVGWSVGDELLVPGLNPDVDEDERRTIASISGSTVTLESALEYDHRPPLDAFDSYALNVSRNITFQSENSTVERRGHGMIMSTGSDIRYAAFNTMGRTDKKKVLSNPPRNADTVSTAEPNPRARYAFHYHHTGIDASEPHYAQGLVALDSPGWGFVNHHAYAHITDCITYDVDGAGFVTEGGNERGSFRRNFALRSQGSGEKIDSRAAGKAGGDPPVDDFGHAGHGFWMQSPLTELVGNVAAGHRQYGLALWSRPLLDGSMAECTSVDDSRVNYCPNLPMKYVEGQEPLLEAISVERFSTNDSLMNDTQKVPSGFVKFQRVEDNTIFASAGGLEVSRNQFKWIHERWEDFSVVDGLHVYNIGPFVDADGEVHEPDDGLPKHRSGRRNGNQAINARYITNIEIRNALLYGNGDGLAVPAHDYRWTTLLHNCRIENWKWGFAAGEHATSYVRDSSLTGSETDLDWCFNATDGTIVENTVVDSLRTELDYHFKFGEVFDSPQAGVSVDARRVYFAGQDPSYVPIPDQGTHDNFPRSGADDFVAKYDNLDSTEEIIGKTNQELHDTYGFCVGKHLMPGDAESKTWLDGGYIDPETPENPPEGVWIDAANAELTDGFTVSDDSYALDGVSAVSTGTASAPPTDTSNVASVSVDLAGGTYQVWGRIWTDSWNGDTVYYRIDGGEWKPAEKMKSPDGYRWYGAAPNGGQHYEWSLSEGTHTVEFACANDGVRVDQVLLTSDATLAAGYGPVYGGSAESTFAVSTNAPSDITATSATLNGSVNDLGGADSTECYFEWRRVGASDWNATATQTMSSTGSFSATVDGLEDGVDYECRAVADASDGDSDNGSIESFVTTDDPPAVATDAPSSVTETSGMLHGSLDDLGGASSADCYFEWQQTGASSWHTTAVQTLSSTGTLSESVTGLEDGVDYEYRIVANASDDDTTAGSNVSFTTADAAPSVTTTTPSGVGETTATLNGSLDDLANASSADCYFQYRESGSSSWSATNTQTLSSTGSYSHEVSGLSTGTDYECRAVADASDGDSTTGTAVTFSTSGSSNAPTLDFSVSTRIAGPWVRVGTSWDVSDADGDLVQVTTELLDSGGAALDSQRSSVSGSEASGSHDVRTRTVEPDSVRVTVSDAAGNSTSDTRFV